MCNNIVCKGTYVKDFLWIDKQWDLEFNIISSFFFGKYVTY